MGILKKVSLYVPLLSVAVRRYGGPASGAQSRFPSRLAKNAPPYMSLPSSAPPSLIVSVVVDVMVGSSPPDADVIVIFCALRSMVRLPFHMNEKSPPAVPPSAPAPTYVMNWPE